MSSHPIVRNPLAQCVGKCRHRTRDAARNELRKVAAQVVGALSCYRCPHCGGWHVGHAFGGIAKRLFFGFRRRKPKRFNPRPSREGVSR